MFLVVTQSDVHFGFEHPFCACPIGCASKITHPKIWAPQKKLPSPVKWGKETK